MDFGIGIGGEYPKEFEAMGVPVNERGPRANEILRLMKRLWTEESVTFAGRFYEMEDIGLEPHPVQKPHPPIYVGGRRKSVRRTGLYGDGWIPYMYSPELFKEGWEQITQIAEEAGRDPEAIDPTVWAPVCIADDYDEGARMSAYGRWVETMGSHLTLLCGNMRYSGHRSRSWSGWASTGRRGWSISYSVRRGRRR